MERKTNGLILRGVRLKIAFLDNLYTNEIVSKFVEKMRRVKLQKK